MKGRTPPREMAALVTESGRTTFAAGLLHFGDQPRSLEAELHLVAPRDYEWTLAPANEVSTPALQRQVWRVEGPRTRIALQLPSRRLCSLTEVVR